MKTKEIDFRKVLEESKAEVERLNIEITDLPEGGQETEECEQLRGQLEEARYKARIAESFIKEHDPTTAPGQVPHGPVVVLKELNLREATEVEDEITEILVVGGKPVPKVRTGLLQIVSLEKGIVRAPFEVTRSVIGELNPHIGKFLYDELDKLNTLDLKKSTVSGSHSSTGQKTGN